MISRDKATQSLQALIDFSSLFPEKLMNLVRLGGDPNTKNSAGFSLLHMLVKKNIDGTLDREIEELVKTHHANINIQDAQGLTPLKHLMKHCFTPEGAMKLVRLGADPNTKNSEGLSLLQTMTKMDDNNPLNQELLQFIRKKDTEFLNLLIRLANDRHNEASISSFKVLPLELICYILSFWSFDGMRRTWKDGYGLSLAVLSNPEIIKKMVTTPGGINVLQRKHYDDNKPEFTFFKSAKTFCEDYKKRKDGLEKTQDHRNPGWDWLTGKKLTNTSLDSLNAFSNAYAILYWQNESSLYEKKKKSQLLKSIKDSEPYTNPEIQSQLELIKSDQLTQPLLTKQI